MRNKILLTLILSVSAAFAVAQQDTTSSAPANSSNQATQAPSSQSPSTTSPSSQAPSSATPDAQSPSSQSPSSMPSSSQSSQGAAAGNTIEGCLGGSAGKFTIIDKAGTTYDLILPQGADTSKLGQHIGQEVAVGGTMSNPGASGSPSAADSNSASSASSSGAGAAAGSHPSIQVTKIDKVADTCSTNSGAKPSSK